MPVGLLIFVAWLAWMVIMVGAFIHWAWKDDQFKDLEEPARRMLEDREPLPWPGREKKAETGKNASSKGSE